MMLAAAAALAIVVQDHTSVRAAASAAATELTALWPGDVVEVRGEHAGYLRIYNHAHERGGYVRGDSVRAIDLSAAGAAQLLSVLRFLRDSPGEESLGISYGAAYLRAVPARALTAEPFDAIASMAERLADAASGKGSRLLAAHLEVVGQFGIRMRSFERNGQIQVCYEGELFRRVLSLPGADAETRAHAALGLTRADCIDPAASSLVRAALDAERARLLEGIDDRVLSRLTGARVHARRASVWAALAFTQARRGASATEPAQRALAELAAVQAEELGADRSGEYLDAVLRVGAIRWAAATSPPPAGPLLLRAAAGDPGQTCVTLEAARPQPQTQTQRQRTLARRCTYGIVWSASAQAIAQGRALVVAVQPLESWRELWLFHESAAGWSVEALSPGTADPEEGYVEFAGFAPDTRRLLIVRELKDHGRFVRRFEELRLADLALVRQASRAELLADFRRWQDRAWRRDTLALH